MLAKCVGAPARILDIFKDKKRQIHIKSSDAPIIGSVIGIRPITCFLSSIGIGKFY